MATTRPPRRSLCGPCSASAHTGPGNGGICECDCHRAGSVPASPKEGE